MLLTSSARADPHGFGAWAGERFWGGANDAAIDAAIASFDGAVADAAQAPADAAIVDASADGPERHDAAAPPPFDPCFEGGVRVRLQFRPEFSNWYFGDNAGLRFSADSDPVALTDGALETFEGVATLSDEDGGLLMYTDGRTIWNREHTPMPNGTELGGDASSTQSGVIVAMPGSATRYYVFSTDATAGESGTRYSIVDMELAGGLGDVETSARSVLMHTPTTEKLVAVRHANLRDYWIVTHDVDSSCFRVWPLTRDGLGEAVLSCVGSSVSSASATISQTQGQMKVNRWGNRIAIAHYGNPTGLQRFELLDFDAETGAVSNARTLMTGVKAYGLEFSPAGTRLFGTSGPDRQIFQWDLCAEDIAASRVTIATIDGPSTGIVTVGSLQLGPDGRMYIAASGSSRDFPQGLSVIRAPDELGAAVDYEFRAVDTASRNPRFGLPNFIQFFAKSGDVFY